MLLIKDAESNRGKSTQAHAATKDEATTNTSTSTTTSRSSSLPVSRQLVPSAAADVNLDDISKRLRSAPGVSKHPVSAVSPINPLWGMILQGWNFENEILPVVSQLAMRAKPGTIRSWKYFVDEIVAQRQNAPALPPSSPLTREDWLSRLRFARRNGTWDSPKWGPMPNQEHCQVPPDLVLHDDGKGWSEWQAAS